MKPLCDDPDCTVCTFRRKFPHEDRILLIASLSSVVRLLVEADAEVTEFVQKAAIIGQLFEVDQEDLQKQMPFEQIVRRTLAHRMSQDPSILNDIQVILEVCVSLLPQETITLMEEMIRVVVSGLVKESNVKVNPELIIDELRGFVKNIQQSGMETLAGNTSIPHGSKLN